MPKTEQELIERIKYLEELVAITPIRKAFKPLTMLEETKNKLASMRKPDGLINGELNE